MEKLHQKARDLMSRLDKKYKRKSCLSLDEYYVEYNFTEEENKEISSILNTYYEKFSI